MENQDFSKIGQEIKDAVNQAIDTMDFSKLNDAISYTVDSAVKEVQNRVNRAVWTAQDRVDDGMKDMQDRMNDTMDYLRRQVSEKEKRYRYTAGNGKDGSVRNRNRAREAQKERDSKAEERRRETEVQMSGRGDLYGKAPGSVASVLYIVFGSILACSFGIPALVSAALGIGFGSFGTFQRLGLFFFLPLTLASAGMMGYGIRLAKRRGRFRSYVKSIGTKTICAIKTLSRAVGKPEGYVCDDLQKMIQDGLFLQGHIDEEKTCLMVTEETYELYLQAKERSRTAQKEREKEQEREREKRMQEEKENPKQKETLDEGLRCVEIIRCANEELPDPVISEKLEKLEKVIGLIYVRLRRSPEKLDSMKRFTDYYLPTTIKLVEAYREFEKSEMETERIAASKKEIEQTLDTINLAFERMLDSLYEEDTMDITTDIQVLQTLLAQEGLTQDGMHSMDDIFEGVSGARRL